MTWDVIGQERAVAQLRRAAEDEARLSHAYLFAGPEHVGRATAARRFAQALNCESDGERPCDACRSCRLIAEDKHPDIEWVRVGGLCNESEHKDHSKDNSRDIRICQIRRLERIVSRTAVDARYRVIIVDPAEAMTIEAANAFLKTLEEPAANVVLILIAAREEVLRETVRSRCRRIAFYGVPKQQVEDALRERWNADAGTAGRLARLAQGRIGWAVNALADESVLGDREEAMDVVEATTAGDYGERFAYAGSLGRDFTRDPGSVRAALAVWQDWWRDVLLTAAGQEALASESGRLDTLRAHAAQYGVQGAVRSLMAIKNAAQHLEEHASPTLALEVMLLELPQAARRSHR